MNDPARSSLFRRAWPLLPLLALTMGLKVAPVRNGFRPDQAAIATERRDIVSWLTGQGFRVESPVDPGLATVTGFRSPCRLTIVAIDARGFQRQLIGTMRPAGADLYFVHQGQIYPEQPVWRTAYHHHLWARARDLGIRLPRSLVFGVIAQSCRATTLDWASAGRLP